MIRIGRENERKIRQHADEGEICHRVVGQLVVDRGGDRVSARQDRDRRAVGRRTGDGRGRRGAAGARARLDHDRLAEALAEVLGDEARDDVDIRAGREPVHHGDGPAALGKGRSHGHRRKAGERGAAGQVVVMVVLHWLQRRPDASGDQPPQQRFWVMPARSPPCSRLRA